MTVFLREELCLTPLLPEVGTGDPGDGRSSGAATPAAPAAPAAPASHAFRDGLGATGSGALGDSEEGRCECDKLWASVSFDSDVPLAEDPLALFQTEAPAGPSSHYDSGLVVQAATNPDTSTPTSTRALAPAAGDHPVPPSSQTAGPGRTRSQSLEASHQKEAPSSKNLKLQVAAAGPPVGAWCETCGKRK